MVEKKKSFGVGATIGKKMCANGAHLTSTKVVHFYIYAVFWNKK
jgi:hypothetical protein